MKLGTSNRHVAMWVATAENVFKVTGSKDQGHAATAMDGNFVNSIAPEPLTGSEQKVTQIFIVIIRR